MFALILAVVFSGNSEDRLPEISLSFNVPKVSIVRDSMNIVAPKKVTWDDMNKLKNPRKVETPKDEFVVVMDNW